MARKRQPKPRPLPLQVDPADWPANAFESKDQSRIRERTQAVGSANHSRLRGHREHGI